MANLRTFSVGQHLNRVIFDTTKSVSDVVAILSALDYENDPTLNEEGTINLLDTAGTNDDNGVLYATNYGLQNQVYLVTLTKRNVADPIVVFSSADVPEMGLTAGFQNLQEDGSIDVIWNVNTIYQGSVWNNGLIVGSSIIDLVETGTYNDTTGEWNETASYSITADQSSYVASGVVPYGGADSLFPTAGYRFAVRIARPTITSKEQLASGNICLITNVEQEGQYFEHTKASFEDDGSLIAVFAPVAETLSATRQVKIAWGVEGELTEDDYTVYTFDLSNVSLAHIPTNIETDKCIGYCIVPKIQSEKLIKVRVPEGGLYAGQLVNCVRLETEVDTLGANLEVYVADKPTQSTVNSKFIAMISNHSGVEELEDGRRPNGQPDYTKYHFKKGDVADAVLMDKNLVFEVSTAVVSNGNPLDVKQDVGRFIIPLDGTYNGRVSDIPSEGSCLEIIGTHYFRRGNDFKPTYIARGYRQ